ncbi:12428_t:CDS:2, partial [Racocetra fulgida]
VIGLDSFSYNRYKLFRFRAVYRPSSEFLPLGVSVDKQLSDNILSVIHYTLYQKIITKLLVLFIKTVDLISGSDLKVSYSVERFAEPFPVTLSTADEMSSKSQPTNESESEPSSSPQRVIDSEEELSSVGSDDNDDNGKRRRQNRDPNAPKRPRNAFLMYCQMQREQAREENQNKGFQDMFIYAGGINSDYVGDELDSVSEEMVDELAADRDANGWHGPAHELSEDQAEASPLHIKMLLLIFGIKIEFLNKPFNHQEFYHQ